MNEIPSNISADPDFIAASEIADICKKRGFDQFCIFFGERIDNMNTHWRAHGNVKSEGLAEVLREHSELIQDELDELNDL